ncbi:hypothetical protein [Bifidobacterium parmae]|uniref:Uncharacterized protein n=1 Tax=Bifidobacterium parmae TaxID=361854 RepID=A0A2N5IWV7_9BIFI|nr:hypothetical protein [Bifidobacterium parmae]PLS26431.1 hypothetical protein Uis4E_2006 [Bifidobacterium parmae]
MNMSETGAGKTPRSKSSDYVRMRFFGAAFTLAVCGVTAIVCGAIRYDWHDRQFRIIALPAALALLVAVVFTIRGSMYLRRESAQSPTAGYASRTSHAHAQILSIIGINLWGVLLIVSTVFLIRPLQYVTWGAALAILLYLLAMPVLRLLFHR